MLTHCPACKAKDSGNPLCRRCGLDLAALKNVLKKADNHKQEARQAFLDDDFIRMLIHARHSLSLRYTPDAFQLAACSALLNRNFQEALRMWRHCRRLSSNRP